MGVSMMRRESAQADYWVIFRTVVDNIRFIKDVALSHACSGVPKHDLELQRCVRHTSTRSSKPRTARYEYIDAQTRS